MTIHSYRRRQDKRLEKAVLTAEDEHITLKWLQLQSQCMNTKVGRSPTAFYPIRQFGCVKAASVTGRSRLFCLFNTHYSPHPRGSAQDMTTTVPDQLASEPLPTCS